MNKWIVFGVGVLVVIVGFFIFDSGTYDTNLDRGVVSTCEIRSAFSTGEACPTADERDTGASKKLGGEIVMGVGAVMALLSFAIRPRPTAPPPPAA